MTRDPSNPNRTYPEQRKYVRLADLPDSDRPATFPVRIEEFTPPPPSDEWHDPARLSADRFVRWCSACDTVLRPEGQSPFCEYCRGQYRAIARRRERESERATALVDRAHLATLFDLAERLQGDLGVLSTVYNERPQDLQRYMNEAMLNSKSFIHHLVSRLDDPRGPGRAEGGEPRSVRPPA